MTIADHRRAPEELVPMSFELLSYKVVWQDGLATYELQVKDHPWLVYVPVSRVAISLQANGRPGVMMPAWLAYNKELIAELPKAEGA